MEVGKHDSAKIDSVFHKLAEARQDMDDEAAALWENGFGEKLIKQNFLHFGWAHYNLYTLAAVWFTGVSVFTMLSFSAYYVLTSIPSTSPSSLPINTQMTGESTVVSNPNRNPSDQNKAYVSGQKNQASGIKKTSKELNATPPTGWIDSTALAPVETAFEKPAEHIQENISTDKTPLTKPIPLIKKEKRTVYIQNRDTLETVDTIRSKKEWRKLKNNK